MYMASGTVTFEGGSSITNTTSVRFALRMRACGCTRRHSSNKYTRARARANKHAYGRTRVRFNAHAHARTHAHPVSQVQCECGRYAACCMLYLACTTRSTAQYPSATLGTLDIRSVPFQRH